MNDHHTRGSWQIMAADLLTVVVGDRPCGVLPWTPIAAALPDHVGEDEAAANARLIRGAPRLLAAMRRALPFLAGHGSQAALAALHEASEAIACATAGGLAKPKPSGAPCAICGQPTTISPSAIKAGEALFHRLCAGLPPTPEPKEQP